ncbi:MAG: ribosome-associated translation inhibitor RaiA [Planctomycetes bacterium]|nr:ribosome-associated translation inhibitor RaiA [Planctomycetota bacterium]
MTQDAEVRIEFKGRHDHITERMQEHATKKLQRLSRFEDALTRIEVVADHAHENPEIEIIAHLRKGAPMIAKDRGESFSGTVDLLVDKMEVQLRKWKEKLTNHKFPDAKEERARAAASQDQAARPDEETYEDAVRKTLDK